MKRATLRLVLGAAPLLLVWGLFELQMQYGILRNLNPISRYVALAVAVVLLFESLAIQKRRAAWPAQLVTLFDATTVATMIASSAAALCFLAILINWSNGGTQDVSAIGGVLPYSDAAGYFEGAERLVYDGSLTPWNERRPLNAAFLAARLILTGNNFFSAVLIQALLAAIALFLSTCAIYQTHGRSAGLVFFVLNFSFLSCCLHRTLSEPLGISLGLFGFALLWVGIANKHLSIYALGAFALALALLARAGAMFALPACVVFAALFFSASWKQRISSILATTIAIGIAWLVNHVIILLYGTANGTLLSNFSYTIYGLSQGGTNWAQGLTDFPQLAGADDGKIANFLYQKAFEAIVTKPYLLIWGLTKSLALGIATFPAHILRLIADGTDGGLPWNPTHVVVAGILVLPLLGVGIFNLIRSRNDLDRFHYFLIVQLVAFVGSLPFFYIDGGIRLTAATFPFTAATMAIVLTTLLPPMVIREKKQVRSIIGISAFSAVAIVAIVSMLAPKLNQLNQKSAVIATGHQCKENETELGIRIGYGSARINILNDSNKPSIAPNIRPTDFFVSEANEAKQKWRSLSAPATVLLAYDTRSGSLRHVLGPVGFADGPSKFTTLCAQPKNLFTEITGVK